MFEMGISVSLELEEGEASMKACGCFRCAARHATSGWREEKIGTDDNAPVRIWYLW